MMSLRNINSEGNFIISKLDEEIMMNIIFRKKNSSNVMTDVKQDITGIAPVLYISFVLLNDLYISSHLCVYDVQCISLLSFNL